MSGGKRYINFVNGNVKSLPRTNRNDSGLTVDIRVCLMLALIAFPGSFAHKRNLLDGLIVFQYI